MTLLIEAAMDALQAGEKVLVYYKGKLFGTGSLVDEIEKFQLRLTEVANSANVKLRTVRDVPKLPTKLQTAEWRKTGHKQEKYLSLLLQYIGYKNTNVAYNVQTKPCGWNDELFPCKMWDELHNLV
jgi:hypothetical protein